jgi:hypothetical protein
MPQCLKSFLSKLNYEISKPNVLSPQAPTNNT